MRALVVDDQAVNRSIIVEMLSSVGIAAREADGACAGIEMLEVEHFDLVVMDVHMPVVDGIEAIRRIRGLPGAGARVPIIVVTGDVMDDCVARARAVGADSVLYKPLSLVDFLSTVAHRISGGQELLLA